MSNETGIIDPRQPLTMSSREIAELTGKRHADVMRDIRVTFETLDIGLSKFASSYQNDQNKRQPCFNLPKRETLILVSGYSVELRAQLIRENELETIKHWIKRAIYN